jgi:hypothetical protein
MTQIDTITISELIYKIIVYSSGQTQEFFLPQHDLAACHSLEEAQLYNDIEFARITQSPENLPRRKYLSKQRKFLASLKDIEKKLRKDLGGPLKEFKKGIPHSVLQFEVMVSSDNSTEEDPIAVTQESAFDWGKKKYGIEISPWKPVQINDAAREPDSEIPEEFDTIATSQRGLVVGADELLIQLFSFIDDSLLKLKEYVISQKTSGMPPDTSPTQRVESAKVVTDPAFGPAHEVRDTNTKVTLFFVAVALANQLERIRHDTPEAIVNKAAFIQDKDKLNAEALAQYLENSGSRGLSGSLDSSSVKTNPPNGSEDKTEIALFLITSRLAEVLMDAIKDGAFVAWSNEKKGQLQDYISSNGVFKAAPIERYITSHTIEKSSGIAAMKFTNQQPTAIQKRLSKSSKNWSTLSISNFGAADFCHCIKEAEHQYRKQVKCIKKG